MLKNKRTIIFFFLGLVTALGVAAFFIISPNQELPEEPTLEVVPQIESDTMARALPTKLRIPTLSMEASFVDPLGLLPDGEVEVPDSYTEVGWYKFSPTPGELGPAVILGHVDSYKGPAILFSLGQLKVGDQVFVDREDGSTAVFEVTELERPRQAAFPTARVYGDIDHAGLRIITCSGIYVRGTQRYTHNLIVYAKLVVS